MVHTGFIGLYVTIQKFAQKWENRITWYTQGGYACIFLYIHFLDNETHALYGNIPDLYTRVIWYEYILIYRTVGNMFRIVMTNAHEHVTTILICHFTLRERYYSII